MNFKRLENFIFDKMSAMNTAGVSMALIQGEEIIWSRGFGFRSVEERLPATPETVYDVASVTKSFTAAAILLLAEQGKLNLSDPVAKFIPDFTINPFGEIITIEHLLTHSSGIPGLGVSERMVGAVKGTRNDLMPIVDFEDYLLFIQDADQWVVARPGERYLYSNTGYVLLGYIIQQCSGVPFKDFMKSNIFEPLGMLRSYLTKKEVEADHDVATLHGIVDGRRIPMPYPFGSTPSHSGLITSVNDLARFIIMFNQQGEYRGRRVMAAETVEAILTPRIQIDSSGEMSYGYGMDLIPNFFGYKLAGHGGWIDISTSYMGFIPEKQLGVAVLVNGAGYIPNFMGMVGLAMLLGEDPEELPFIKRDRMLDELAGTYYTFRDTIPAKVKRMGAFLVLELQIENYRTITVPLVPDTMTETHRSFYTMLLTRRKEMEFIMKDGQVEMHYDRWLFRKA